MTSTIQTPPHGASASSNAPSGASQPLAGQATTTPAGVAEPMSTQVSSEQMAMKLLLDDAASGSAASAPESAEVEPTANSNGAPWLATPSTTPLSAADLADWLSVMNNESAENQIGPLQQQLKTKNTQQMQALERSNALILKNIDLAKQADARRKAGGILGWIKKAATFAAAAVAVAVISFVAAPVAPLVIAVAVGALLNASLSMASDISQACGGPALPDSMAAALSAGLTALLVQAGVDKDMATGLGMVISGSLALVACLATGNPAALMADPAFAGQLVGGAAMLGGSGEAMTQTVAGWTTVAASVLTAVTLIALTGPMALTDRASMVLKATKTFSAATEVGTGAYQAKIDIDIGRLRAQQIDLQADNAQIAALISRLQSQWEAVKDELNRVIAALNDNNAVIADILNGDQEQKSRMLAQFNSKAAV